MYLPLHTNRATAALAGMGPGPTQPAAQPGPLPQEPLPLQLQRCEVQLEQLEADMSRMNLKADLELAHVKHAGGNHHAAPSGTPCTALHACFSFKVMEDGVDVLHQGEVIPASSNPGQGPSAASSRQGGLEAAPGASRWEGGLTVPHASSSCQQPSRAAFIKAMAVIGGSSLHVLVCSSSEAWDRGKGHVMQQLGAWDRGKGQGQQGKTRIWYGWGREAGWAVHSPS